MQLLAYMFKQKDTKSTKAVIWVSSLVRWLLGLVFLYMAYLLRKEAGTWILLLFGSVLFVSGFFRPKRCIDDRCDL